MSDTDTLLTYYAELLVAQYYRKPKATGTVRAFVRAMVADSIFAQVRDGFDVDTAIGAQLDVLGELRGVTRYYYTLDLSKTYMAVPAYADDVPTYPGLDTYDAATHPSVQYFMLYDDFTACTLSDADFRRMITFLASAHSSNCTIGYLDDLCYEYFGVNVNILDAVSVTTTTYVTLPRYEAFDVADVTGLALYAGGVPTAHTMLYSDTVIAPAAMSLTYQHLASDTNDLFSALRQTGNLPKPAGVHVDAIDVPTF